MDPDFERQNAVPVAPSRSGKIIISGGAFLISAPAWAYAAFEEYTFGGQLFGIYAVLVVLHAVMGIVLLLRLRAAWFPGLLLAVTSIGIAIYGERFPLSGVDALAGVLLFLSRSEFFPSSSRDQR